MKNTGISLFYRLQSSIHRLYANFDEIIKYVNAENNSGEFMTHTYRRSQGAMVAGIILISIGFVFMLRNFNLLHIHSVWSHWPLIFVLIGVIKLFAVESKKQFGEAVWWIFIGAWLYVSIRHVFDLSFSDTWPALIIAWGISIIWKSYVRNSYSLAKE
jgi:tetrahydromethanopterin S-methyltransferase subunit F